MYLHDMNRLDGNCMPTYCGDSVARLGGQILRCCILSGHFSFQGLSGRHLQLADPTLRADPEAESAPGMEFQWSQRLFQ